MAGWAAAPPWVRRPLRAAPPTRAPCPPAAQMPPRAVRWAIAPEFATLAEECRLRPAFFFSALFHRQARRAAPFAPAARIERRRRIARELHCDQVRHSAHAAAALVHHAARIAPAKQCVE